MTIDEVQLEIPGSAEYLRLARLAAADVGARAGFSYEDIDDLRIAVDEFCYAIGGADRDARLTLVYRVSDQRVEVQGQCDRAGVGPKTSELGRAIIGAVVDEYDLSQDDDGCHFRFVKATPDE